MASKKPNPVDDHYNDKDENIVTCFSVILLFGCWNVARIPNSSPCNVDKLWNFSKTLSYFFGWHFSVIG